MVTTDKYAEYKRSWRAREEERSTHLRALSGEARAEASHLAQLLVSQFGATRVILFGSLARGDPRREDFDIDLAVEGIAPERLFQAGGEIRMGASRDLDLVDLAAVSEGMRVLIMEQGVSLYEQGHRIEAVG